MTVHTTSVSMLRSTIKTGYDVCKSPTKTHSNATPMPPAISSVLVRPVHVHFVPGQIHLAKVLLFVQCPNVAHRSDGNAKTLAWTNCGPGRAILSCRWVIRHQARHRLSHLVTGVVLCNGSVLFFFSTTSVCWSMIHSYAASITD